MSNVTNFYFLNSEVKDATYIGLAIGACFDVWILESKFQNIGRPIPTTTSAPAIWVDKISGVSSERVTIENNLFLNNKWSAAYFMPLGGSFSNNVCISNGESTVFVNEFGKNLKFVNNYINGTTRSNISASGLEIGGTEHVISNNIVQNCAADGIIITNCNHTLVTGNQCFNNGKENTYAPFQLSAGITVAASTSTAQNIISNNVCFDNQGTKTQIFGILLYKAPAASAIANTLVTNNVVTGNLTQGIRDHNGTSVDGSTILDNNIGAA
jgi:parallel beta-helix repeat protein